MCAGAIPDIGAWFPIHFAAGGNSSYPDYWVIADNPRYLGYKTLIVAPEPFVERAARAGPMKGGRIGTIMILWGPLRDSEV
jgi:hypothetical protein